MLNEISQKSIPQICSLHNVKWKRCDPFWCSLSPWLLNRTVYYYLITCTPIHRGMQSLHGVTILYQGSHRILWWPRFGFRGWGRKYYECLNACTIHGNKPANFLTLAKGGWLLAYCITASLKIMHFMAYGTLYWAKLFLICCSFDKKYSSPTRQLVLKHMRDGRALKVWKWIGYSSPKMQILVLPRRRSMSWG